MANAPPKSFRITHGQGSREWSIANDVFMKRLKLMNNSGKLRSGPNCGCQEVGGGLVSRWRCCHELFPLMQPRPDYSDHQPVLACQTRYYIIRSIVGLANECWSWKPYVNASQQIFRMSVLECPLHVLFLPLSPIHREVPQDGLSCNFICGKRSVPKTCVTATFVWW